MSLSLQDYVVVLESSLSTHSYNLTWKEVIVPGNRDAHVSLSFSVTELPVLPDSQRGSVIALIITVAIIFALVNVDKV